MARRQRHAARLLVLVCTKSSTLNTKCREKLLAATVIRSEMGLLRNINVKAYFNKTLSFIQCFVKDAAALG